MDSFRDSFQYDFCMNEDVRYIEEAISNAQSLKSLSLTVCCAPSHTFSLSGLNGHNSLRELSLCIDGTLNLPEDLPCLESLTLELMDSCHEYYWRQLAHCQYPKLKRLEIISSVHSSMPLRWTYRSLHGHLTWNRLPYADLNESILWMRLVILGLILIWTCIMLSQFVSPRLKQAKGND